ncbi:MAG: hypothetical protein JRJ75_04910 [Deltaproteobacteria bacterium]|nr:hypothetical protein [Deltaproteobacteria bacterium]MBW1928358.1 hypothetical protein [Deltaproteobacteria bacterium]MBW2027195.1 hypothetical protein [Deltaproteobacteria bacterium]
MKILHIFKSEPDETTKILVDIVSNGKETTFFDLFKDDTDYDELIDLIFEHDKVITWW